MTEDASLNASRDAVEAAALGFRDAANSNEDFVIFKTLVGFDSVYPPAWDDPKFQHQEAETYRAERVEQLLASVNEASVEMWLDRVKRYAETKSDDLATFPVFGKFLEQIGERHPLVALGYLDHLSSSLVRFLPDMLSGLRRSAERARAQARV